MMIRPLITFGLVLINLNLSSDCIPWNQTFLEYSSQIATMETGLVFVGQPTGNEEFPAQWTKMMEIEVLEIWCGETIHQLNDDASEWASEYIGSDNKIWIKGTEGISSDYRYLPGRYIITTIWTGHYFESEDCVPFRINIETFEATLLSEIKEQFLLETNNCEKSLSIDDIAVGKVQIYPNPSSESINIKIDEHQARANLTIRNAQGQLVISTTTQQNQMPLDIRYLSPGIYFLEITDGESFKKQASFVKY